MKELIAFMTINLDGSFQVHQTESCRKLRVVGRKREYEQPPTKIRRTQNFENSQLKFDFP